MRRTTLKLKPALRLSPRAFTGELVGQVSQDMATQALHVYVTLIRTHTHTLAPFRVRLGTNRDRGASKDFCAVNTTI